MAEKSHQDDIDQLLRGMPLMKAPDHFSHLVMDRIQFQQEEAQRQSGPVSIETGLLVFSLAAVLVSLVLFVDLGFVEAFLFRFVSAIPKYIGQMNTMMKSIAGVEGAMIQLILITLGAVSLLWVADKYIFRNLRANQSNLYF